ncbi:MAG: hypothetical protein FD135_5518, partial [Comamonadaceae bacterium]
MATVVSLSGVSGAAVATASGADGDLAAVLRFELFDIGLDFLFMRCPWRLIGVFLGKALPYPRLGGFLELTWSGL